MPKLRAYVRAALRNESRADECLALAIERLTRLYETGSLLADENIEIRMYRLIEGVIQKSTGDNFHRAAWRAILLVHLEGFSAQETARILGLEYRFVEKLTELPD
ncbi:MAG: hypothetical protein AAFV59_17085 [Pseudomonadota bacterium]